MIQVRYSTIDRFSKAATFKTLKGAQAFAEKWVGKTPEMGGTYAISGDGVGKITCRGCKLADLFPATVEEPEVEWPIYRSGEEAYDDAEQAAYDAAHPHPGVYRITGCTCSDEQLTRVGCECPASYDDMPF